MKRLKAWPELEIYERLEPYYYSTEFPPRWFNLENYTNIVSRSVAAWSEAVSARHFVKVKFVDEGPDDASWAMYFMSSFYLAQETLSELSKEDFEGGGRETAMVDMDAFSYAKFLSAYLQVAPDLPLDEILDYENGLTIIPPSDASESLLKQYSLVTNLPVWRMQSDIRETLFSQVGSLVPVYLDVAAPDELIAKSAVEYAKTIREKLGISNLKQKIATKDIDKWIDQRLLAYIDLTLWFEAVGAKPPIHQIADLIFPEKSDVDTSEFIRKTVRKNAHLLMSASIGGALTAQAGTNDLADIEDLAE
ncbi:DUF6387 family protein [Pseudomonas sp. BGI-2]|uniref:DUF6387 family protein n=1 Tax=Pseudomonas sp. BGI-2 TaxID=2528211 RepID=UPI0010347092|nr:DUF6387 family protein [Pseudomonas sp. BGI-2]TBN49155.1 hypothetical protein EYC95_06330 [Pseudomonas sp. BGI-2]